MSVTISRALQQSEQAFVMARQRVRLVSRHLSRLLLALLTN